ncbi:MAG TPA: hypothetical protein VFU72_02590 [Nitrolancea sp.]|nr:hypothetical protein [Nitrolancea sp.]
MKTYRTIQYGLGPIGQEVARLALAHPGIEVAGAVDIDPNKVGKDLGQVVGLGRDVGVTVSSDAGQVFQAANADVVLHTTGSSLRQVMPQLDGILKAGLNVVSTTEELAYPVANRVELAQQLDQLGKARGATLLGTGVNPGFVMDSLPIYFTAIAQKVDKVFIERLQNASTRRQPLQAKIGSGKTIEEFRQLVEAGKVRHVGLQESVFMLAAALGWQLDDYSESTNPVVADHQITTQYFDVKPGQVAGVDQLGLGFVKGQEKIRLHLKMYLDANPAQDRVMLEGPTPLELIIPGSLQGDRATTAIVMNSIPQVVAHSGGLVSMIDLPLVHAWGQQ